MSVESGEAGGGISLQELQKELPVDNAEQLLAAAALAAGEKPAVVIEAPQYPSGLVAYEEDDEEALEAKSAATAMDTASSSAAGPSSSAAALPAVPAEVLTTIVPGAPPASVTTPVPVPTRPSSTSSSSSSTSTSTSTSASSSSASTTTATPAVSGETKGETASTAGVAPMDAKAEAHAKWVKERPPIHDGEAAYPETMDESSDSSDDDSDEDVTGAAIPYTGDPEKDRAILEKLMFTAEDEDTGVNVLGAPKTAHEMDPPPPPPVSEFKIGPDDPIEKCGTIMSVVENNIVVEGISGKPALDLGSLLCLADRTPLGLIDDTIGPVSEPFYAVRVNTKAGDVDMSKYEEDADVYFVKGKSGFVLAQHTPGSDASNPHDEEVAEDEADFSDDEKEMEAKRRRKEARRLQAGATARGGGRGGSRVGAGASAGTRVEGADGAEAEFSFDGASAFDDDDEEEQGGSAASPATRGSGASGHKPLFSIQRGGRGGSGRGRGRGSGRCESNRGGRGGSRGGSSSAGASSSGTSAPGVAPPTQYPPGSAPPPPPPMFFPPQQHQQQQPYMPFGGGQHGGFHPPGATVVYQPVYVPVPMQQHGGMPFHPPPPPPPPGQQQSAYPAFIPAPHGAPGSAWGTPSMVHPSMPQQQQQQGQGQGQQQR